jgi:OmcA/MtrC family decaheme c-type cytochrome
MKLSGFKRFLMIFGLIVSVALLVGCDGDDGRDGMDGADGVDGADGADGADGEDGEDYDPLAAIQPESCSVCHKDAGAEGHQSVYDDYLDGLTASKLALEIQGIESVADGAGAFNVTMTVGIMKDGLPLVDAAGLPTLDQNRFYINGYDTATGTYPGALNERLRDPVPVAGQPGVYAVTATGVSFAPEDSNTQAYAYIAQGPLHTEPAGHVHLYEDVASAGMIFGVVPEYESLANPEGCAKCHGSPYAKHGYREAAVENLGDFASCKACHYDDRTGGHEEWQQMVDDPVAWGNGDSAEIPAYAYTANVMNDTHMSHAMEFPFPQSMSNCTTCHEGKLADVTDGDFFVAETCKSCHPVQSTPVEYVQPKRAPAMEDIWIAAGVDGLHDIDMVCNDCHSDGGSFTEFAEMHTGYDPEIYDENGVKWSELYTADITGLSMADGVIDLTFTANTELMTTPTALFSFYGYDTKQFIVSSHTRDADRKNLEKTIGTDNPYIAEAADSVQGAWHLTFPIDSYAVYPLQEMMDDGEIKRLEVSIRPRVEVNDEVVATNAVSETLDLVTNTVDDDYFKGANAVVDVEGCNSCHDALATTFHSGDRGGDITVCKHCHYPGNGGSHLEMTSREIGSYVHAIHSFQPFDTDEINFADNVEAKRYGLHIEHTLPTFTAKACEACHLPGTYEAPDQSESLPHKWSDSWVNEGGPDGEDTWMRSIGGVPDYVTGPAARACGGCHKAEMINEDHAGELVSFHTHIQGGGYLVEDDEGVYEAVVEKIMSLFEN